MTPAASAATVTRDELDLNMIPQTSVAITTPKTDQPATSYASFPLFNLPAELREMIYAEAITSGTMGLLRASHRIYQEASPLTQKAGIFRILTRIYGDEYYITPTPAATPPSFPIQNIEISVTIRCVNTFDRYDSGVIDAFTDAAAVVQRDTCYITFRGSILERFNGRPKYLLSVIRRLTGFKRIIVTAIATGIWDKDVRGVETVIRARNKPLYEMMLDELEDVFGPGLWHDAATQEGRYLEFRPE